MNLNRFFCYSEQSAKENNKKDLTGLALTLSIIFLAILAGAIIVFIVLFKPSGYGSTQDAISTALITIFTLMIFVPFRVIFDDGGRGVAYAVDSFGSLYIVTVTDAISSWYGSENDFLHIKDKMKNPDEIYQMILNPKEQWGVAIWRVDKVHSFVDKGYIAKSKIEYCDMKTGRTARKSIKIRKNYNSIEELLSLFEKGIS